VISSAVVADTHAIVWYLADSTELSVRALSALDGAAQGNGPIYVASITLVELVYLVERGRVAAGSLNSLIALLDAGNSALHLVPLDGHVARALRQIPRDTVPDMPDRIIAATGLYLNVPVVTRDHHIQAASIATIW